MNRAKEGLLNLIAAAVSSASAPRGLEYTTEEWTEIFCLAREQELLPLVFEQASRTSGFSALERAERRKLQEEALQAFLRQVMQANEFLTLYQQAQGLGLQGLVVKGIVCRSLYPVPGLRPSVDEDLLIPAGETEQWHSFLLEEGLFADDPKADRYAVSELSYHREGSPTYLELHKSLFPESSSAYGDLNTLFDGVWERSVPLQVEDVTLRTLAPTDHLLFLMCHAYKHFLHSGVGLRQAADIALFVRAYSSEIDGDRLYEACGRAHIRQFSAALFRIGSRHLGIDCMPAAFAGIETDEGPLLEDMLSAGVYGNADADRAHSGRITLEAVSADRQGREEKGILRSLFPGKEYLQKSYPYAKEHPVLLPVAWGERIVRFVGNRRTNATRTMQIGRERIELLRLYDIIE